MVAYFGVRLSKGGAMSRIGPIGCAVVILISAIAVAEISEGIPYLLAGLDHLASYPQPLSAERNPAAARIYAIVLPETERVVLLRPILETEYGSFQVQAIAPELIDAQMLAAAMVLPVIAAEDVFSFPDELLVLLQTAVNQISGYPVFPDVMVPG